MVKTLLLIVFLLFSICGICDLIYTLRMLFYYPKTKINNYALVVLKKGCALKQLNFIWQKIRWNGDGFATGIIAIIDCIEANEIAICNSYAYQKNIILCVASSVSDCKLLQGELINGNRG